ncbi:hypothetical protein [Haloprofundus halobius]|uniref:hypothetical protein n=1 Tax=Haloprofundus halobius TaxID=2876194 RepID=UPI001CCC32BA|nr:hypothetical protein [Haloprofundus halobius]
MPRDTLVSWRTFALFVLLPPAAIAAIVFFPVTLLVPFWLYYRGKLRAKADSALSERCYCQPPWGVASHVLTGRRPTHP